MTAKNEPGKEIVNKVLGTRLTQGLHGFLEKIKPGSGEDWLNMNAEFYADSVLDLKTKQLLVITCLITQKGALPQLREHLLGCKNVGLTKEEVLAAMMHLILYIGYPPVVNALELVEEVYGK